MPLPVLLIASMFVSFVPAIVIGLVFVALSKKFRPDQKPRYLLIFGLPYAVLIAVAPYCMDLKMDRPIREEFEAVTKALNELNKVSGESACETPPKK